MAPRVWRKPRLFECTFWASVSKVEPYQIPSLFIWPSTWQGFQREFFHCAHDLITDVALDQCLYWGKKRKGREAQRHIMTLSARSLAECPGFVSSSASDLQRVFEGLCAAGWLS